MAFYNPLTGIDWGTKVTGQTVSYYLYTTGTQVVNGSGPLVATGWNTYEKAQLAKAFQMFSDIANIKFVETTTEAGATFRLVNAPFPGGGLGEFEPPGETRAGLGAFNVEGQGWDRATTGGGLEVGGYGFITLIHEIGHGLGLAHPHDDGGGSTIFPGVTGPHGSLGDFQLNQGINTMMSYNDGWQTAPHGASTSNAYGWQARPMAFDIAVLQSKYGANMSYHKGDDVYDLPGENGPGTYYEALWDAGGNDTIRYQGTKNAVINLNAASLAFAANGGGDVSYVEGVHGGFTIAHGVVIENAITGSGNDLIIGNAANNVIRPGRGNDVVDAGDGFDNVIIDTARAGTTVAVSRGQVNLTGPEGFDTLIDVERVVFNDATLAFDDAGSAGQAYRLYQAAFDRAPDEAGLGYWIRHLESGKGDVVWVANSFIMSNEFKARYGTPDSVTNDKFVTLLYNNVLHRAPDAEGSAYWQNLLGGSFAREGVLAAFSESAENKSNTWSAIHDGIWYV